MYVNREQLLLFFWGGLINCLKFSPFEIHLNIKKISGRCQFLINLFVFVFRENRFFFLFCVLKVKDENLFREFPTPTSSSAQQQNNVV